MKTPLKSIRDQRKVRELPGKMNIEELEEPKKHENYHAKPVSDPFKTIADHRKVRELPRKMNIEEVEEPEATKIYIQNPSTPAETPFDSPGYEILFRIGCSFSSEASSSLVTTLASALQLACSLVAGACAAQDCEILWESFRQPVYRSMSKYVWAFTLSQLEQDCKQSGQRSKSRLRAFVPWCARMFIWSKRGSASSQWWISYLLVPTQRPGQAYD